MSVAAPALQHKRLAHSAKQQQYLCCSMNSSTVSVSSSTCALPQQQRNSHSAAGLEAEGRGNADLQQQTRAVSCAEQRRGVGEVVGIAFY